VRATVRRMSGHRAALCGAGRLRRTGFSLMISRRSCGKVERRARSLFTGGARRGVVLHTVDTKVARRPTTDGRLVRDGTKVQEVYRALRESATHTHTL